jgi:hypothetical protein
MFAIGALLVAGIAVAQEPDTIMGNWEGKFLQKDWKDKPVSAKVIAKTSGRYNAVLEVPTPDGKTTPVLMIADLAKNKVEFSGKVDVAGTACSVEMKIAGPKLTGKISGKGAPGTFEMARVEKKPPTLGAKPPEGSVVLFDGKNLDAWKPTEEPWAIVDGAMEVRKGSIVSKQEFGDQKLHLEFRTPFMPNQGGQARGNSGVYLQGRYEVQVLDSFGLPSKSDECGGIYKKATPKVNATLPPTEWQTYDVTFLAPKFDDAGKKTKNTVITVVHNGIPIIENVELDSCCGGGVSGEETKVGPLMLQDHHNKVQYRNIWVQPVK